MVQFEKKYAGNIKKWSTLSHTKILNRQPSLSRLEQIQCIPLYLLHEVTGAGFSYGNLDYFWDSVYTVQYLWPKILTYPLNMMTETLRDYREQCIFSLFYHQLKYRNLPKIIFTSVVCIEVGYILQYTYSIANTILYVYTPRKECGHKSNNWQLYCREVTKEWMPYTDKHLSLCTAPFSTCQGKGG